MIYVVYYIQLAILLLSAFFPQYRIWGVNWWTYFPLYVTLTLFGIGCLIPLVVRYFSREAPEKSKAEDDSGQGDDNGKMDSRLPLGYARD